MRWLVGDLIQYDQDDHADKQFRPKDVSEPGLPPGNSILDHSRDDMPGSSGKVIPDTLRVVARFRLESGLGFVYHYTDFEGALGILRSGIINPTTNFAESHKQRGLIPGVSLSRRPDLRRYGAVRFAFDADKIRHNHSMQPFEFGAALRADLPAYTNAEEYVEGPLKIRAALCAVDVLKGFSYRKNNGDYFVEQFKKLTTVPVRVHELKAPPPAQRLAANGGNVASRTAGHPRGKLIDDILSHTDSPVRGRAPRVSIKPLRFDPDQGFWSWAVTGSKGERYFVRIKGWGRANKGRGDLAKTPIRCSCTCPFWRWQGPEHWAKVNGYLYRTWRALPQGTMSFPRIRDPQGKHWACKHLVAVLQKAKTFRFATRLDMSLAGRLIQFEPVPSPTVVAQRFRQALIKFYHGTSLERGERILQEGFSLKDAGNRQRAVHGGSNLDPQGVFLTSDPMVARWYAGSDPKRPGLGQEGLVLEVRLSGSLLPEREWWALKAALAEEMGVSWVWDPRQEHVVREAERRVAKDHAGFWENRTEIVVFSPRSIKVERAFHADTGEPFQQRFATAGSARQTAISLLRDAPDEDMGDLIELARSTPQAVR